MVKVNSWAILLRPKYISKKKMTIAPTPDKAAVGDDPVNKYTPIIIPIRRRHGTTVHIMIARRWRDSVPLIRTLSPTRKRSGFGSEIVIFSPFPSFTPHRRAAGQAPHSPPLSTMTVTVRSFGESAATVAVCSI